ncbi:MAG: hypothetical protein KC457_35540, partial [Myxococcales bacterium]|nr:hypothetical protein [Myxococcales bacterium]
RIDTLDGDTLARVILANYHPDRMRWSLVAPPDVLDAARGHFSPDRVRERSGEALLGFVGR